MFDKVIEPFGGAACYAFRYFYLDVHVNDVNPTTYDIWRFLTWPDAWRAVREYWPDPKRVQVGTDVSRLVDLQNPVHPGFVELLRAHINVGTCGMTGIRHRVTKYGAAHWHRIKPQLRVILDRVKHWTITCMDYRQLQIIERASVFVDPPYIGPKGRKYKCKLEPEAYDDLASWCVNHPAHVIACEHSGADYLPFSLLTDRRLGFKSVHQKDARGEVYFEKWPDVMLRGAIGTLGL